MRPSLRFLGLVVVGWAGVRAATVGALPGAEIFQVGRSEAKVPPIVPTEFPPIEPFEAAGPDPAPFDLQQASPGYAQQPPVAVMASPMTIPVYYVPASAPAGPSGSTRLTNILPEPRAPFFAPTPVLDEWPLSRIAATSMPPMRSSVVVPAQSTPAPPRPKGIDRLQLTTWALLRSQQAGIAGSRALAGNGSLGASQAGARLAYNFSPQVAAVLRSTSEVGRRGGELAAGVRIQPARGIPLWLTAERRQRVGLYGGGRNAFAFFFEGGLYDRPMPLRFRLDTYVQGGVVGLRSRDRFIDGALTLTRPVYKQYSAGVGVWGGAQRGAYRLDAGPRVSMRVRNNVRVHVDWRQRLAGNANPGSGPAITLAGDF